MRTVDMIHLPWKPLGITEQGVLLSFILCQESQRLCSCGALFCQPLTRCVAPGNLSGPVSYLVVSGAPLTSCQEGRMKNVSRASTLEGACSPVACCSCPSDPYRRYIILREGLEGLFTEQKLKVQRGGGHYLRLHSRPMLMVAGVVKGRAGVRSGSVVPECGNGVSSPHYNQAQMSQLKGFLTITVMPREGKTSNLLPYECESLWPEQCGPPWARDALIWGHREGHHFLASAFPVSECEIGS